ncbi:MAG: tRNA uridine-5-carboxymethylaminomethyl(34) synthesis GTPase MnmE [Rhodoplanes sp.]|uniref:tRNA uridine-5-carboxymethylaminomethyl(34) synthesis GTPase MnmE n=1 Tax=Rhodoplanes sp. TaxID=1968906 RepID=UPI001805551D|nr:tRNA uridine-5-carboxymethylaminomethyl(34) synthesis GTPase MnmE [Rhodoplanes sp.]NVO12996.1 tRNA uridine-5-carboxymethylaminomethyl(34) synthesis GTPase MnmE [Rhodoplanes sp.]
MICPATDTIFALSSGRPPAAIAVVRVSGPAAGEALRRLAGRLPEPRRATLVTVREPATGEAIDQALVLWFPGPHSETGEDTAELQVHGGRAVIAGVLKTLAGVPGCRPAEAGEFTKRAFDNGKLDLTRVEGLADLIGADTEAQRRQALRHLRGLLGDRAETWRQRLIEAQALVEAGIDFSDEGDVPAELLGPALASIGGLRGDISAALADGRRGERLRDGLVVAIAGPPNAGKSSLLNRIVRREAAIVSPVPGTTRDVVEVHLDLGGQPVTLLDTAGLRESDDPVEQEGVRRARDRAAAADLVLWVQEAGAQPTDSRPDGLGEGIWTVITKVDLRGDRGGIGTAAGPGGVFETSARTGEGIAGLMAALEAEAVARVGAGEPALVTRVRHRAILEEAVSALDRALAEPEGREEFLAEDLRLAARALGRLVGRVDVEDILDVIFRDFCIGK